MRPKSLTGTIHLPNARCNFHFIFDAQESGEEESGGKVGRIMDKASEVPVDLQEILADFAEFLAEKIEK